MAEQDPRFKNKLPEASEISGYLKGYVQELSVALSKVSAEQLKKAESLLLKTIENGNRVYVAGNGGSASIGDHLCCDWLKGTFVSGKPALKVHALASNTALLTALANDFGYEKSFAAQIEMLGEKGDVAVLISSSGNSPNIIAAAEIAQKKGMIILGMSGFEGGKLSQISDISLHVPVHNYGIAEDGHQIMMHVLTQSLNKHRDSKKDSR